MSFCHIDKEHFRAHRVFRTDSFVIEVFIDPCDIFPHLRITQLCHADIATRSIAKYPDLFECASLISTLSEYTEDTRHQMDFYHYISYATDDVLRILQREQDATLNL